jgi:nucleotide-binding universal stress UspA family protein
MIEMFAKILVATDGSDKALQAAQAARTIAEKFGSAVILLNVIQPFFVIPGLGAGDTITFSTTLNEELEEISNNALTRTRAEFGDDLSNVMVRSEWGHPVERIVSVIEEEGVDLVVVGNKGLSGLEQLLLGSVSGKVVQHASCSVLVVR